MILYKRNGEVSMENYNIELRGEVVVGPYHDIVFMGIGEKVLAQPHI